MKRDGGETFFFLGGLCRRVDDFGGGDEDFKENLCGSGSATPHGGNDRTSSGAFRLRRGLLVACIDGAVTGDVASPVGQAIVATLDVNLDSTGFSVPVGIGGDVGEGVVVCSHVDGFGHGARDIVGAEEGMAAGLVGEVVHSAVFSYELGFEVGGHSGVVERIVLEGARGPCGEGCGECCVGLHAARVDGIDSYLAAGEIGGERGDLPGEVRGVVEDTGASKGGGRVRDDVWMR